MSATAFPKRDLMSASTAPPDRGARPRPRRAAAPRSLFRLHEAVAGGLDYSADTFRRAMLPMLAETRRRSEGTVGKPAQLYVRRGPVARTVP
jgi:hypothetical protein